MAKGRSTASQKGEPGEEAGTGRPGGSGEEEQLSTAPEGNSAVADEFELRIETPEIPNSGEAPDDESEDEIEPPLSDEEVLEALEFVTDIMAEAERDERYRLDRRERERLVPFLREQLNGRQGLIRAVRSLDFFDGWGIVAYAIVRRAVLYYRAHLEEKWPMPWKKHAPSDQEGAKLVHRL
jgi:hypothetical protein